MLTPQSAGLSQYQASHPNQLAGYKDGQVTVSTKSDPPWLLYLGLALLAYYLYRQQSRKAAPKRARVSG